MRKYNYSNHNKIKSFLQNLRQVGVVGKFVEFFGPGVTQLSIADRATISNMCPEYGATVGFFPVDQQSLAYLRQTGDYNNNSFCNDHLIKTNKYFLSLSSHIHNS